MNDPVLFINSVSDKKEGTTNQDYFDSREITNRKKQIKHRIDDLRAMIFFKISAYALISTNNSKIEGFIDTIDEQNIYLNNKNVIKKVNIDDIEDIVVRKV